MITIKTEEHGKKITKTIFEAIKGKKLTLNTFRSELASACGFSSFSSAFKQEKKTPYDWFSDCYISEIDCPVVTIEMAQGYASAMEDGTTRDFLASAILDVDKYNRTEARKHRYESRYIPVIADKGQLQARLEEICALFCITKSYNMHSLYVALLKISMPQRRIADSVSWNPERRIAIEFISHFSDSSISDQYMALMDFTEDDLIEEDGYKDLRAKMGMFIKGYIWSASHVGNSIHDISFTSEHERSRAK